MKKYFILLDFVFVTGSFVAVRCVMVMSPLFNTQTAQWNQTRYWVAGIFASVVYIILSSLNGFYIRFAEAESKKFPVVNLINCAVIFGLGLVACLRYSSVFTDSQLLSKKVLFLSVLAIYFLTTFTRYIIKSKN